MQLFKKDSFLFVCLITLSFILRLFFYLQITSVNALGFEEYQTAEIAYRFIKFGEFISLEHLLTNFLAILAFVFLDINIYSLKILFVLTQSTVIGFFYLFLRSFFSKKVSLITSTFFLFSYVHIIGSNIADELFTGLIIEVPLMLFFTRALITKKKRYFLLIGFLLGLIAYEYLIYRSVLFFYFLFLLVYFVNKMFKKKDKGMFIVRYVFLITSFLIIAFPLLKISFYGNNLLVEGITRHLNVRFSESYQPIDKVLAKHKEEIPGKMFNKEYLLSRVSNAFSSFYRSSGVLELGSDLPLFEPITLILFFFGVVNILRTMKKNLWRLYFFSWFLLVLLIILIIPINFYSMRFISIFPLLFFFIGCLFNDFENGLIKRIHFSRMFLSVCIFFVMISFAYNMILLFIYRPAQQSVLSVFNEEKSNDLCASNENLYWLCLY